jgi:hypothetical protein
MNNLYYLRNNPVIMMGVIESALQRDGRANVGRIAALLPLLFDERIVEILLNGRNQYNFRQLVLLNNLYLANYNDRYLSLLMPFYRALSIMMDAGAITLSGGDIEPSFNQSFNIAVSSDSGRMKRVAEATGRLLSISEKETNKELYQLLKVAL